MTRAARKSIWDTPPANSSSTGKAAPNSDELPLKGTEPAPPDAPPKPVIEQLRVVEEKQRDRSWERQAENRPMLFRRIPPGLRDAIKEIAYTLQVRVDDVARAFLEFGLLCYQKGEIQIQPILIEGRLTLFPRLDDSRKDKSIPGWYENFREQRLPAKPTHKARQAKANQEKPWKWQVSYRGIPASVQSMLREIHQKKAVPLGEIATLFLGHSLNAYRAGRLVLHPQPRSLPGITVAEMSAEE
jgi:hypothetical protein